MENRSSLIKKEINIEEIITKVSITINIDTLWERDRSFNIDFIFLFYHINSF